MSVLWHVLLLVGFRDSRTTQLGSPISKVCPKCNCEDSKPCAITYQEECYESEDPRYVSGVNNGQAVAYWTKAWTKHRTPLGKAAKPPWTPIYHFVSTRAFFSSFFLPLGFGMFSLGLLGLAPFLILLLFPLRRDNLILLPIWPMLWWPAVVAIGGKLGGVMGMLVSPFLSWPLFLYLFNGMHFLIFLVLDKLVTRIMGWPPYHQRLRTWRHSWICEECYYKWVPETKRPQR